MTLPAHVVASHGILNPLSPSPAVAPPLPDGVTYRLIHNRWQRLLPHITLLGLATTDLALLDHRRECLTLLAEGIPWRAIMRLGLDDPTTHLSDRLYQRERYLSRHRRQCVRKPRGPNRPRPSAPPKES